MADRIEQIKVNWINQVKSDPLHQDHPDRIVSWGDKLFEALRSPRGTLEALKRGAFHPDNKHSRRAFEAVHVVTLPRGVNASFDFIRDMFLAEWDAMVGENHQRELEFQRIEREKREQEEQERCEALLPCVLAGTSLTSGDLEFLAKQAGISIHPRTVASLRSTWEWVEPSRAQYAYRGKHKKKNPSSVCLLYRVIQEHYQELKPAQGGSSGDA